MATAKIVKDVLRGLNKKTTVRKLPIPPYPGKITWMIDIELNCSGDWQETLWHANQLLAPIHHPTLPIDTILPNSSTDVPYPNYPPPTHLQEYRFNYFLSYYVRNP